jgi:thioredoxin-disulfide reductase
MPHDLIIIGGGPAGMTAGIYASRQGLNVLMITKTFGGNMAKKVVPISNYPGFVQVKAKDLIERMEKQMKKQRMELEINEVVSVEKKEDMFSVHTTDQKLFKSRTVVVASGSDPRPLEVPGEKEFLGKGVSYCALCDGPVFSGKDIAIIGGGNAAFETALFMENIAKKIYILEYGSSVKADSENQLLVKKEGKTTVITQAKLEKIEGKRFVDSVVYEDRGTGEKKSLKVEGVFVEIGYQPTTSFVKELVEFNRNDEIVVDFETYQTKTPGLFAAGDVNIGKFKQIVTACGEGAKAALAAFDYLQRIS